MTSSVPSIIANSSSSDQSIVTSSRSDADGEEPSGSASAASFVSVPPDDNNRTAVRQPADGLGNSNTDNAVAWRTNNDNEERRLMSWSIDDNDDDGDDDDEVPPTFRLRPVLIGGEDNVQNNYSDNEDVLLANLSFNSPN